MTAFNFSPCVYVQQLLSGTDIQKICETVYLN